MSKVLRMSCQNWGQRLDGIFVVSVSTSHTFIADECDSSLNCALARLEQRSIDMDLGQPSWSELWNVASQAKSNPTSNKSSHVHDPSSLTL